jgi:hypothetical protein
MVFRYFQLITINQKSLKTEKGGRHAEEILDGIGIVAGDAGIALHGFMPEESAGSGSGAGPCRPGP